eukprot:1451897-Prymnesium_polylepis.1
MHKVRGLVQQFRRARQGHDPHARVVICQPRPVPGEHDPVRIICGPARGEAACQLLLLHLLDEPQQQRVE